MKKNYLVLIAFFVFTQLPTYLDAKFEPFVSYSLLVMEHPPQVKADEEYPLLKVETGGGDGKARNSIPANVTTGWNVTCAPTQSWCSRWPEFISAFWMTLILLAISFLVFYALGMSAYRRKPIVIVRCNNTKPGSDVFYHHIIPRDANVPFSIFSDYLSFMARQYPSLRFSVYFLIDDSWPLHSSRHSNSRLLNRLVPHMSSPFNTVFNNKRDIKDFQNRYQNVKICVMLLSKYMGMTPLKYKWRMIPQNNLSFYARIFEIWQNGGFGFDLILFNNQFNSNGELDRRVDTILKSLNNGIESEKYVDILNAIDDEEQNELFSMFFHFMNHIVNETRALFNRELITNFTVVENTPILRTRRSKRDVDDNLNISNVTSKNYFLRNNSTLALNETRKNLTKPGDETQLNSHKTSNNSAELLSVTESGVPENIFFYDFSSIFGDAGPSYYLPKPIVQSNVAPISTFRAKYSMDHDQRRPNYLLLTPEGHFIATSSRHHPFLTQLFSSSCFRLNPKTAIKDTLLSQCSGFLRDDIYCENIRVIYNVI